MKNERLWKRRSDSHETSCGVRSTKASELAEFGPTLFVVFVMLLFPLISLGTVALRYSMLVYAARLAASAAAKCSTYKVDANPPRDCSAVNVANSVANRFVLDFSGITLTEVKCYIVASPFNGNSVLRQSAPLATAADTDSYSYDIEVVLSGRVSPLVESSESSLFNIPGLTAPLSLSVSADAVVESAQGLTQ